MSEYRRFTPRDAHERVLRALFALYPRAFRREFGDAMLEFFRDRLAESRAAHGRLGVVETWASTTADVARQAPLAWFDVARDAVTSRRARIVRHFAWRGAQSSLAPPRRRASMWASLMKDVRYALRGVLRTPVFSCVVILTLALGLGANVAIFSVVRGVLLEPLPFDRPNELVRLRREEPYGSTSEPEFADYRREAKSLAGLAAYTLSTSSLTGAGGDAERVSVGVVSDGFFPVMRTPALLGRTFTTDEEKPGGTPVAVLSHALWQRRYGGDSAVVGRSITLNGTSRLVVGVMPRRFPAPNEQVALWTPLRLRYDSLWERNNHYLDVVGRLAPGATLGGARAELAALAARATRDFPAFYRPDAPLRVRVIPLAELVVGDARPYLLSLFGAVGFVLLIACVNVAGLLLARGEARRKEWAIRAAMGASRGRLVRQTLTESLLHALAGGALGALLAWWGVRLLRLAAPSDLPRVGEIEVNASVLAFATLLALFTGVAFGAWPALRGSRGDAAETLREGGKGAGSAARGAGRARRRLVVAEMAIAVITLTGAGLMLRALWSLQSVDLGFEPDGAITMQVALPPTTYGGERPVAFYRDLLERVRAVPNVRSAGVVQDLPVADGYSSLSMVLDGMPAGAVSETPDATPLTVSPGLFAAMGITLVRGRLLTDADGADAPLVVVVSEEMVKRHWPTRDPLGATLRMYGLEGKWATVVGVVRDVRMSGYVGDVPPTVYFPLAQAGESAYQTPTRMSLVIRANGDPGALAAPVRTIVREMEPEAPVSRVQTMAQVVAGSVETRAFATRLLAAFALLALTLAGIGLYGVIAYSVTQRRHELGVRLALGARRSQVLSLVLGEGVRTAMLGAAIGVLGSVALAQLLRSAFTHVAPWDPATLGAVIVALGFVALVSSYLPARRASRIDPLPALRAE